MPPSPSENFWSQLKSLGTGTDPAFWSLVKAQALAGSLVVITSSIFGGVIYLTFTVPKKLDEVLAKQGEYQIRLQHVEKQCDSNAERIMRLETRP